MSQRRKESKYNSPGFSILLFCPLQPSSYFFTSLLSSPCCSLSPHSTHYIMLPELLSYQFLTSNYTSTQKEERSNHQTRQRRVPGRKYFWVFFGMMENNTIQGSRKEHTYITGYQMEFGRLRERMGALKVSDELRPRSRCCYCLQPGNWCVKRLLE